MPPGSGSAEEVAQWVEVYRNLWDESFDRLDTFLQWTQPAPMKGRKNGRKQRQDRSETDIHHHPLIQGSPRPACGRRGAKLTSLTAGGAEGLLH
jgi:hypothetical protein